MNTRFLATLTDWTLAALVTLETYVPCLFFHSLCRLLLAWTQGRPSDANPTNRMRTFAHYATHARLTYLLIFPPTPDPSRGDKWKRKTNREQRH